MPTVVGATCNRCNHEHRGVDPTGAAIACEGQTSPPWYPSGTVFSAKEGPIIRYRIMERTLRLKNGKHIWEYTLDVEDSHTHQPKVWDDDMIDFCLEEGSIRTTAVRVSDELAPAI